MDIDVFWSNSSNKFICALFRHKQAGRKLSDATILFKKGDTITQWFGTDGAE